MPSKHLSVKEFGATHGLSVSTVWRYIRDGKLPFSQPGGRRHRVTIPEDAVLTQREQPETLQTTENNPTESPPPLKHLSGPKPAWMRAGST
jgi:hypothetical protein